MTVSVDDQASALRAMVARADRGQARPRTPARWTEETVTRAPLAPPSDVATRPRRAGVVAIASGKGGVGKTSLSVSLAAALAQTSRDVILLDGDVGLANADVLCGVRPTSHLGHLLNGERTLERVLLDAPGNFRLVPGASGLSGLLRAAEERPQIMLDRLTALERMCDALIIDCGAGINRVVRAFLASADLPVIVATPEPTSITDAYALLKLAVHDRARREVKPAPPLLLVNMAPDEKAALRVHDRISAVSSRFLGVKPALLGWIPLDDGVRAAGGARRPFVLASPRRPASRAIVALSGRVAGRLRLDHAEPTPGPSPLSRLLGLLQGV